MKTRTKLILAIAIAVFVMGFIVLWDLVIKENIESTEVVVVKPGVVIHKYDEIHSDDLMVEKRNRATLIEGYIKGDELKSLVGKQAGQILVGNQILSKRYLQDDVFTPDPKEGEAIRPIPNQWIFALPATLRRHDTIDIYLVKDEKAVSNETTRRSNASYVGTSPEQDLANAENAESAKEADKEFEEQREEIAEKKNLPLKPYSFLGAEADIQQYKDNREALLSAKGINEVQWQEFALNGDIPILVDVPVAYAKDSSGNEIHSGTTAEQQAVKKDERLTSTGTITNLELLLDENDHRLMMDYVQNGYKLYITYN